MEGRLLGDFVVGARLGQGGFGTVYLAQQPRLEREVVVKVLHGRPEGAPLARFLREAQLASRLDHPYAAHVYAFDIERDGTAWIAMERVRGTPLSELLRAQGPLPLERLVPLVEKLCEVVHTAHELGIVHRDLKPANVMVVARAGQLLPKLLDLGIAKQQGVGPRRAETNRVVSRGAAAVAATAATVAATSSQGAAATVTADVAESRESVGPNLAQVVSAARTAELTLEGAVLGSPHYMAPEQWDDAGDVDGRADIYALGVLCWELSTGQLPFQGGTLAALAAAHRHGAPAAWPAHLPPAVGALLGRTLAKRREDRPASALELAHELRAAAGLVDDAAPLPRLADGSRRFALADAPQPLAEAVAVLDAARHPHQAREALRQVVRVASHVVGLWALAARAHSAPPGGDDAEVAARIRRLRQDGLDARGWWDLARGLCRPFVALREAHPLPELVDLCAGASAAFDGLLADSEGGAADEDAVRAWLAQTLPRVDALLAELAFLGAYPLVVVRRGVAERWTGVRRPVRVPASLRGALADDRPALLDREGVPLVSLWPFVQVAEPAPGAPAELFLLAGAGRHGARLVALPGALERDDDEPWGALVAAFRTTLGDEGAAASEARAPWLGLAPFTRGDAALYVGREREALTLVNRLRVDSLAAVVGPSGAGKSSFVHAGVLPALPADWQVLTLRPGAAPLAALGARVGGVDARDPEAFARALGARAAGQPLLLVVDQLEELFTLGASETERAQVARALAAAAAGDGLRVVVTLRDDFLVRAAALPALGPLLGRALTLVTTPAAEDLRRILVEPARRAGYAFEDAALPEEMVAEVAGAPAALALLSFAATRLWELRDRHFRQLSRKAHAAIGGVVGALARHAEDTLAAMRPGEQRLAREAFRRLVTAEGTRAVLAVSELEQVLGGGAEATAVLERLVDARLLTVAEDDTGGRRIEVVHEALLSAWPRLDAWRHEDASSTRLRDQLRAAARQWDERGRQAGLLWRREALAEFRLWRARSDVALTDTEAAFAAASLAEEARGRRVRAVLAGVAFVALAAAVVALWAANQRTSRQRAVAESAEHAASASAAALRKTHLAQEQELGRLALLAGDPLRALPYLSDVYSAGVDSPALRFLISRALEDSPVTTLTHDGWVVGVDVAPDGTKIVTCGADGRVRLWTIAGAKLGEWTGFGEVVWACRFSPDGTRILGAGSDGTAGILDVATGAKVASWKADATKVRAAAFSPDGRWVATGGNDAHVRLWDAANGAAHLDLHDAGHDAVRGVVYSRDGARLASWSYPDSTVEVWDTRRGTRLASLKPPMRIVGAVTFDAEGARVAIATDLGAVGVWDAASARQVLALTGHTDSVNSVELSPDGARFLTASVDHTARLWDARTGQALRVLEGSTGELAGARFSPDGARAFTWGKDGWARVYEVAGGRLVKEMRGHTGALSGGALIPDGTRLVTTGYDGTARLWSLDRHGVVAFGQGEGLVRAALSPDGARVYTSGATIDVWSSESGAHLATLFPGGPFAVTIEVSPDGRHLALGAEDGVYLLELPSGRTLWHLPIHAMVLSLAFSADGQRLVEGGQDATARVVATATGQVLASREVPGKDWVENVALSPDGAHVAIASRGREGHVRLVDAEHLADVAPGRALGGLSAAFDGTGRRVVTADALSHNVARVHEVASGRVLATMEGNEDELTNAVFSPDGNLVATSSRDGRVRLWDAATGRLLSTMTASRSVVIGVRFDASGTRLLTYGWDGVARLWRLPGGTPSAEEVAAFTRCRAPFRIVADELEPVAPDVTACAP